MRKYIIVGGLIAVILVAYGTVERQAQSLCLRQLSLEHDLNSALTVGDSVQFRAGRTDMMMECDLDPPIGVRWRSSNSAILHVTSNGWVRAEAPGFASVIVRAGVSGAAHLDIRVGATRK